MRYWATLATISATEHTSGCITRALAMARENGARDLSEALECVRVWESDGGLANYGACTCDHATAYFPCNRFDTSWPYRDGEFETRTDAPAGSHFHALVDASQRMISASYGWPANRAWKVYAEAWAIQDEREWIEARAHAEYDAARREVLNETQGLSEHLDAIEKGL